MTAQDDGWDNWPAMAAPTRDAPPVGVMDRTLLLLEVFEQDGGPVSLGELVAATGLPKSTVHRMAQQLVAWGGLEQVDGRYCLGMRLFELGQRVLRQRQLREAALPFMEDLYEATHAIVHLGVLDGHDVVYLERLKGHRGPSCPSRVGGRMPAHCTGIGKVLLANAPPALVEDLLRRPLERRTAYTITDARVLREELAAVRCRGVAFDREEAQLGLACVAAPVTTPAGTVAALSVAAPSHRASLESLAPAVRTAALGLARTITTTPPA
jgi:IclR family transcriptional regulator, acetate operon repressor